MLFDDTYHSIKDSKKGLYKERGSKFINFATPVYSEEEVKAKLKKTREKYPDASHHCYAFVLHPDKSHQNFSDDGEPSNTAGRPILRQIMALDLTNVLVISVRYFGGKKLGVPGLIEAYGNSAKEVLALCHIEEKFLEDYYTLTSSFENQNHVFTALNKYESRIIEQNYTNTECILSSAVRRKDSPDFENEVKHNHLLKLKFVETK